MPKQHESGSSSVPSSLSSSTGRGRGGQQQTTPPHRLHSSSTSSHVTAQQRRTRHTRNPHEASEPHQNTTGRALLEAYRYNHEDHVSPEGMSMSSSSGEDLMNTTIPITTVAHLPDPNPITNQHELLQQVIQQSLDIVSSPTTVESPANDVPFSAVNALRGSRSSTIPTSNRNGIMGSISGVLDNRRVLLDDGRLDVQPSSTLDEEEGEELMYNDDVAISHLSSQQRRQQLSSILRRAMMIIEIDDLGRMDEILERQPRHRGFRHSRERTERGRRRERGGDSNGQGRESADDDRYYESGTEAPQ